MNTRCAFSVLVLAAFLAVPIVPPAAAYPAAKTYLVNVNGCASDLNPGDGVCSINPSGDCTLTAAIQEANLDGVPSTIRFAHRFQGANAIQCSEFPALTADGTTIDASDQWDGAGQVPGVRLFSDLNYVLELNGANHITLYGLQIDGGSNVDGLRMNTCSDNVIGGPGFGQKNVFRTGRDGIWIQGGGNHIISNNAFGTLDGESVYGIGEHGIFIQATDPIVISNNQIVGQSVAGVLLSGYNTLVFENLIGVNPSSTKALPNQTGVAVWADYNTIGPGNVIAGNDGHGIELYHASNTLITGNQIGTQWTGIGNGNDGIYGRVNSNANLIRSNWIAYNQGNGIRMLESKAAEIELNVIAWNVLDGIHLESSDHVVGGAESLGNRIYENGANGIHLDGASASIISGNQIGFNLGTPGYNGGNLGYGILAENGSTGNTIGGGLTGEGNWIGFNHADGIRLQGADTAENFVVGNLLGAAPGWEWEAPNGHHGIGVYDSAHHNWIGMYMAGNLVLTSKWSGIALVESSNNIVLQNRVGTDGANLDWGNDYYGVAVVNGSGNLIHLNEIAYNGKQGAQAGVQIDGTASTGNAITQNSIYTNSGPGIQLVNGGNLLLPAPVITQAGCQGPVEGTACLNCMVEIFSDDEDEGRYFEGSLNAGPNGAFVLNKAPSGPFITATARDAAGNTSAFSAPFHVEVCNTPPVAKFTFKPSAGDTSTVFWFDASASSDKEDPPAALEVRWDWENDGIYDTPWSLDKTASHVFTAPGLYLVRLQVADSGGLTATTTRQVLVFELGACRRLYLPLAVR
jgi:hypothetical protein